MKNVLRSTLVLIALAVLILPAILLYPLNMDNDVLQSQGLELLRHVGLPFLGSWDQNFPGTVFIHWFAIT